MKRHYKALGFIAGAAVILTAVMVWNANASPIQRNVTVQLSGLAPSTPALKIVFLADLHLASVGDTPSRLRETVSRVNALRPDIVLIGGDYDGDTALGRSGMRPIATALAMLRTRFGAFATFGNHEYPDPERRTWLLKRAGIRTLDNSVESAGPFSIVGISDAFTGHDRTGEALAIARRKGGVPIVLTHSPDAIPELPPGIELALAGHTHCGQVVLPWIGALDTRSRYGRRYICGVVREGRRTSIITSGLGVSRLPLRLNAPPDFWVITIVPRKAA